MPHHSRFAKAAHKEPRQGSCVAQREAAEKEGKRNYKPDVTLCLLLTSSTILLESAMTFFIHSVHG